MNGTMSTLEALRARKAARVEARNAEAEARELEELQLEEKYEETAGRRGIDFEIVNTEIGLFVVRKPEFIVAKKFNAIPADKRGDEDVMGFVMPCVAHPDASSFRQMVMEHGGIAWRCAMACIALYEARASERAGKY